MSRRTELIVFGGLLVAAVLFWALVPTYPNYDPYYHLVWGREILDGITPTFDAYVAPTEHPLYLGLATVLVAVFGQDADRALVLVTGLSFVVLVWAVYRLSRACFGEWSGRAAALFVGTNFALLILAARAFVDIPFLAAVFVAGAIEAQSPARRQGRAELGGRTGRLAMSVLVVAGLLRPEAWVLAGLYWLWCGWRRWDLLALAILAPAVWAAVDLAATGDPLHSFTATSMLADQLGHSGSASTLPKDLVVFLSSVARPPVALLGVVGLVLAARDPMRRSLHVPIALLVAGVITFLGSGVAGLSIIPRYLTVPAVALCCFAGFAALGFTERRPGTKARTRWMALVAVGALVGVTYFAFKLSVADRLVTELRFLRSTHVQLVQALESPAAGRGRACGPVTFPNYRLTPDARWILDAPAAAVSARSDQRRPYGVAMFAADHKTLKRYGEADGVTRTTNVPDPGFHVVFRNKQFVAYVSCPRR